MIRDTSFDDARIEIQHIQKEIRSVSNNHRRCGTATLPEIVLDLNNQKDWLLICPTFMQRPQIDFARRLQILCQVIWVSQLLPFGKAIPKEVKPVLLGLSHSLENKIFPSGFSEDVETVIP